MNPSILDAAHSDYDLLAPLLEQAPDAVATTPPSDQVLAAVRRIAYRVLHDTMYRAVMNTHFELGVGAALDQPHPFPAEHDAIGSPESDLAARFQSLFLLAIARLLKGADESSTAPVRLSPDRFAALKDHRNASPALGLRLAAGGGSDTPALDPPGSRITQGRLEDADYKFSEGIVTIELPTGNIILEPNDVRLVLGDQTVLVPFQADEKSASFRVPTNLQDPMRDALFVHRLDVEGDSDAGRDSP